jgi:hypothetical protein
MVIWTRPLPAFVAFFSVIGCAEVQETKLERAGSVKGDTYPVVAKSRLFGEPIQAIWAWDENQVAIGGDDGFFAYSRDGGAEWIVGPRVPVAIEPNTVDRLKGGDPQHLWATTSATGESFERKVWYWPRSGGSWKGFSIGAVAEDVAPLRGSAAIVAIGDSLVRIDGGHSEESQALDGAPRWVRRLGFLPQRIAASGDGKVVVACGSSPSKTVPDGCWSARDVNWENGSATFTPLSGPRGVEAWSAHPWVDVSGRTALVIDGFNQYRFDAGSNHWRRSPVAETGHWRLVPGPVGAAPWLWTNHAGTFDLLREDGGKEKVTSNHKGRIDPTNLAIVRDGSAHGAWAIINQRVMRRTAGGSLEPGWRDQGPLGPYRVVPRGDGGPGVLSQWRFGSGRVAVGIESAYTRVSPEQSGGDRFDHHELEIDGVPDASVTASGVLVAPCQAITTRTPSLFGREDPGFELCMRERGKEWEPVKGPLRIRAVHCVIDTERCWAVGDKQAVWYRASAEAGWREVVTVPGRSSLTRAVVVGETVLLLGDGGTVLEGRAVGRPWKKHEAGDSVIEAAIVTGDAAVLGDRGGRLYRFTLATESANVEGIPSPTTSGVAALAQDAAGALYVATAARDVYRSTDGAASWSRISFPRPLYPAPGGSLLTAAFEQGRGSPAVWFAEQSACRMEPVFRGRLERVELASGPNKLPKPVKLGLVPHVLGGASVRVTFAEDIPDPPPNVAVSLGRGGRTLESEGCSQASVALPPVKGASCVVSKGTGGRELRVELSTGMAGLFGTEKLAAIEISTTGEHQPGATPTVHRERFVAVPALSFAPVFLTTYRWPLLSAAGVVATLGALLVLYWLSPLSVHWLYSRWPSSESSPELARGAAPLVELAGWTVFPVRLFLPILATRTRVLDAWVRHVADKFRIESLPSASSTPPERVDGYQPLPVRVSGTSRRFHGPEEARKLFTQALKTGSVIAIVGPGGVGKSMLLAQLLRWIGPNVLGHPAIVLVDDEPGDQLFTRDDDVLGRIRDRIKARIDPERREPSKFVRALLETGRIVLAVDRLSELEEAPRKRVLDLRESFAARYVVVTARPSRQEERGNAPAFRPVLNMDVIEVEPALLGPEDIPEFIRGLLPNGTLDEVERTGRITASAAMFLDRELRKRNRVARIPALVVRLFVDQLRTRNLEAGESLPSSVAGLFFAYAARCAHAAGGDRLDAEVLGAMRTLACESVMLDATIRTVAKARARSLFPALSKKESSFQKLVDAGVLTSTNDRVRFALDPVAEYLAMEQHALEAHAASKGSLDPWRQVDKALRQAPGLREVFRRVLEIRASEYAFRLPDGLLDAGAPEDA